MSTLAQEVAIGPAPGKPTSPSVSRVVKQGGALALGGQGIKLALQLGATAVLARLLSPQDFGLLSLVTPLVTFFVVFRDVGLTSATIFTDDITDAEVSSLFWINVAAGVLFACLMLLLAPVAAGFFEEPRLTAILSVMALTFVFNGILAQYQALFQRRFLFKRLTAIDVGANIAGTLIGIAAALRGYGYWSLIFIPVATQLFALVATALLSAWQPGAPRWEKRTGAMATFGSQITGFNFLNYFSRNIDNLLIGKVWGLEALGFYGRAYGLMMAPLSQVIYPLNQVVVPVLTRLNADRAHYRETYIRIARVVMLVCVPLVTWLLVARTWVVDLLLGQQWGAVAPIYLALGFSALVQPMNNSTAWLLLSQGRSRDMLLTGVIGCVVTVGSIVFGLQWGALAVAISYSLGQILVMTPFLWWFACRNQRVRILDLVKTAFPFWLTSAAAGLSFEVFRYGYWSDADTSSFAGLALSFVWVVGLHLALVALFPGGRKLLGQTTRALRDLLARRAQAAPESRDLHG